MLFTQALLEVLNIPWDLTDVEIVSEGRWTLTKTGIAEIDGKFYRFTFEDPATEMQDLDDPWNYADPVEGVEVERREVVTTHWVPVES